MDRMFLVHSNAHDALIPISKCELSLVITDKAKKFFGVEDICIIINNGINRRIVCYQTEQIAISAWKIILNQIQDENISIIEIAEPKIAYDL